MYWVKLKWGGKELGPMHDKAGLRIAWWTLRTGANSPTEKVGQQRATKCQKNNCISSLKIDHLAVMIQNFLKNENLPLGFENADIVQIPQLRCSPTHTKIPGQIWLSRKKWRKDLWFAFRTSTNIDKQTLNGSISKNRIFSSGITNQNKIHNQFAGELRGLLK